MWPNSKATDVHRTVEPAATLVDSGDRGCKSLHALNLKKMINILQIILENKILYILVLLVIIYLASKLLAWFIRAIIHAFVKKTKTHVDDLILDKTKHWIVGLFFFIAVRAFIMPLVNGVLNKLNDSIIVFLITMVVIVILGVIVDTWGKMWASRTKSTLDDTLIPLFRKLSNIILGVVGFLVILKVWNVNITPFLAGAGVFCFAW